MINVYDGATWLPCVYKVFHFLRITDVRSMSPGCWANIYANINIAK